jgi:hypothetical protein
MMETEPSGYQPRGQGRSSEMDWIDGITDRLSGLGDITARAMFGGHGLGLQRPARSVGGMADQPRKHHYVPQFYLAGFTETGARDGRLYVLDRRTLRRWQSTPKNSAHQRDFHAIESGPVGDPMAVEKALSQVEGKWSAATRSVIRDKLLPSDDAVTDLFALVAFMALRVRRIRSEIKEFIDRASKDELRATFSSREGRENVRRALANQGNELDEAELADLAEFIERDAYEVNFDQTWEVQTMIGLSIRLLLVLGMRRWSLWVVAEDAPDLICSDSPVSLTWLTPSVEPYSPGFGKANTLVTMPLSRRLALASSFEPLMERRIIERREVAEINSRTAMLATQLFSADPDFVWRMGDNRLGNASELIAALEAGRRRPDAE